MARKYQSILILRSFYTNQAWPLTFIKESFNTYDLKNLNPFLKHNGASLVVQTVKNLLAIPETWVPFLGWEDSLEKGMATHSSILAWEIPWTKEPCGLHSIPAVGSSLSVATPAPSDTDLGTEEHKASAPWDL